MTALPFSEQDFVELIERNETNRRLLDVLPDAKQHLRVALTQRPEALEAVGYLTGE